MSKQFDDTNRFTLFKSDKKAAAIQQGDGNAESWADYTGSINVGGNDYWLNAWIKTSKSGTKFMSGTVRIKDGGPARKPTYSKADTVSRQTTAAEDMGDEIPF
jgi:hypothetical protein